MQQTNIWEKLSGKYLKSIKEDKTGTFAYERLVNSLSVLSLCSNSGTALDLGCGDGRFTKDLEGRYEDVYGIDASKTLLKSAEKKCVKTTFVKGDIENDFPKFDVSFDLVTCKLVLMYLKNIETVAQVVASIIKPGGIFVISVTHPMRLISGFKRGITDKKLFKEYLSETEYNCLVAGDRQLGFNFISRSFGTYVNTFVKYGFYLETVLEPGAPDSFVIDFPSYLPTQGIPLRLNMKFIKK